MSIFAPGNAGGDLARRLLPPAIGIPIALGFLCLQGQRAGWFGSEAGLAGFALCTIALYATLVWRNALRLHRGDPACSTAQSVASDTDRLFTVMANSMPQLAWIARADGHIHWYNERWYNYTGTTPEQMEGWGWQAVHDPRVLPEVMVQWTRSIAAGEPFEMTFPLRGADGQFREFLTRALPVKDAANVVVQWFGTNTDVEASKRIEATLRRSEARLAAAQASARIGSWEVDLASGQVSNSPEMFRILNRDSQLGPVSVEQFTAMIHPDDRERCLAGYAYAFRERGGFRQEMRLIRPDGSVCWLECRAETVFDSAGVPIALAGTSQDITDRKEAENEILRLNAVLEQRVLERTAQLEAANRELEAFSYSVSHDLRAPLRAIDGFAGIVLEDYGAQLPEPARLYLQRICSGGRQMGMLIDDLLAFARLGRQSLERSPVNMVSLVRSALVELRQEQIDRPILIQIGDLEPIDGDSVLLRQVWMNLLSNAIKYTRGRDPAEIEVGCRREDGELVYFVRDNGAGFDMRYADKLFGVFNRLHSNAEFEGTGVGLAIVHRIVQRHGGRVWVSAEVDKGALFSFTLTSRAA